VVVLAAPTVFPRHSAAPAWKPAEVFLHSMSLVMFTTSKLVMLQAVCTSASHASRISVRFFSWAAPGLAVDPEQDRALLLPPPTEVSLWTTELKTLFLPDLLLPVLFCFSILVLCFSKLEMTSFHIFMMVCEVSKHSAEAVLPVDLDPD